MKINGIEFEFDAYEAEDVKKAKEEMKKVHDTLLKAPKGMDRLATIKYVVNTVGKCFDNLFGEGSSKKIFKGKTNLKLAFTSFADLVSEIEKQDSIFEKEVQSFTSKYSPNRVNREARRKKNK